MRAWTLVTAPDEIRGHEDPANGKRWQDVDWKRNFVGENWLDRRNSSFTRVLTPRQSIGPLVRYAAKPLRGLPIE